MAKVEGYDGAVLLARSIAFSCLVYDAGRAGRSLGDFIVDRFRMTFEGERDEESPAWRLAFLQKMVALASEDAAAWDALKQIAKHYTARNKERPDILFDWMAEDVRRPGRGARRAAWRDAVIAMAVGLLVAMQDDMFATRNDATDERSACDAVAHGFSAEGIILTYDNAKRIWLQRHESVIPGLGEVCDRMAGLGRLAAPPVAARGF